MTDVVKAKKIKDFAYLIRYDNPENGVKADILSIKFPESEKKRIGAKISLKNLFGAGEYGKEQVGNKWETFVFTKSFGMLSLETWQAKIAEGLTAASGSEVLPSNVSSPVDIGGYFDETYFSSEYFDTGQKPDRAPKDNTKTDVP